MQPEKRMDAESAFTGSTVLPPAPVTICDSTTEEELGNSATEEPAFMVHAQITCIPMHPKNVQAQSQYNKMILLLSQGQNLHSILISALTC